MIKSSLKKKTQPTHASPVDENAADLLAAQIDAAAGDAPTSALVAAPLGRVPARTQTTILNDPNSGFVGEFDLHDITIPQLKIVQGSGPLSERFSVGSVIYNDELLFRPSDNVASPKPLMRFVLALYQKQWREYLTPEEVAQERMPRTVSTLQEALSLGGSNEWGPEGQRPRWSPSGKLLLLLEEPDNCESAAFYYQVGDKRYAPALMYCANTAYREFAKPIYNRTVLAGTPPESVWWTFHVGKTRSGGHNIFVPVAKTAPRDAVPDEVKELALRFRRFAAAGGGASTGME
jgi:hypothetical protein